MAPLPAVVTIFDLATTASLSTTAVFEAQFTSAGNATTVQVSLSQMASTILTSFLTGTTGLPLVGNGTVLAPSFQVLTVVGGGLGTATLTPFGVTYGRGTSTIGITAAGTTGWSLVANGTALAPTFQQVNLTTGATGVLSVPFGGTNTSILTVNGVIYGAGTSTVGITAAGATGSVLVNATGAFPSFTTAPSIATSVTVPIVIGGTTATSTLALQPTSGAGATGADIVFNVGNNGATQAARIANSGFVTIGPNPSVSTFAFIDINRTAFTGKVFATAPTMRLMAPNATATILELASYTSTIPTNQIIGNAAAGTAGGPAASPVTSIPFNLIGNGYDGTGFQNGAAMQIVTTEQWNATSHGTQVRFLTTPTASTTLGISFTVEASGTATVLGRVVLLPTTAPPAVGTAAVLMSTVSGFGIFIGTGVPSITAGTGSIFLRNDGATATSRIYVNSSGGTTWVGLTATA